MMQTLTIADWHPLTNVNGNNARRHWSVIRKNHDIDRDTTWGAAKHAGWVFVPGRVRLTITLVYGRKYRVDADNLVARCKGAIDGLKGPSGFFADDDTEHLELVVRAVVEPGKKELRIEMESVTP